MIVIYHFSKNGADFYGYEMLYKYIASGVSIFLVHGEIGFNFLMRVFSGLGIDYIFFRISYLLIITILFNHYLKKMSVNANFSIFLWNSIYIIYIMSALRQYLSMLLCLISFYYLSKRRRYLFNLVGLGFHSTSIFPLLFFAIKRKMQNIIILTRKAYLFIILISVLIRYVVPFFIIQLINVLNYFGIAKTASSYIGASDSLLSLGLWSRLVICFIFIFYLRQIEKNKNIAIYFNFYFLGVCLYLLIPYDLIAGRLTNLSKMFEIIIIPYLIFNKKIKERYILFFIFIIYGILILINQLVNQVGYFPYENIVF